MAPSPLALPALFPPGDGAHHAWPTPNYVNPEKRGWAAPASFIALFILTTCVFLARLWARFRITRTGGMDDWLIIAAMPALAGLTVATVLALRVYGFQLHIYDQTPKTLITLREITLAIETIYLGSTTLTKLSILIFYRRITNSQITRRLRMVIWASIFFVAAYGITFVLAIVFTCTPVEAYWYRFTTSWLQTHSYKCIDEVATLVACISISTAQDFIACILPMFVVHQLHLPFRKKMALAAVFLVGLFVCAFGVIRVFYAWSLYYHTKIHPSATYDVTWAMFGSWVSTVVEANIAIWCASAPALKIYFNKWLNQSSGEVRSFQWYGKARQARWREIPPERQAKPKSVSLTTTVELGSDGSRTLVHDGASSSQHDENSPLQRGPVAVTDGRNDSNASAEVTRLEDGPAYVLRELPPTQRSQF